MRSFGVSHTWVVRFMLMKHPRGLKIRVTWTPVFSVAEAKLGKDELTWSSAVPKGVERVSEGT